MPTIVPLVRAAAILPPVNWMRDHGIDAEARLRAAGLNVDPAGDPTHPIALRAGIRLIAEMSREQGPDFSVRTVSDSSAAALGLLGQVLLGARTPREGFQRVVRAYSHHGSHEQFALTTVPDGVILRHSFRVPVDDESLHCCQLYVAALCRSAAAGTGYRGVRVTRVALTPHPLFGLEHVRPHFRGEVVPATARAVEITLDNAAIDCPYIGPRGRALPLPEEGSGVIRGDGTMAGSIRTVLPDLLALGEVSLAAIADLAYMSPRTLQRRLAAEGTSIGSLIEEMRRVVALRALGGAEPVGDIAFQLGYSSTSSLSRAVRRWTASSPRQIRSGSAATGRTRGGLPAGDVNS